MTRHWSNGQEIITKCCSCQKVLNAAGVWQDVEESPGQMHETVFTHSVCPACVLVLYPELVPPEASMGKKKKQAAKLRP